MQPRALRLISWLVLLLLAVALAALVFWTAGSQPTTLVLPTPIPQPTATPTITPTPQPTATPTPLPPAVAAAVVRVDAGGYAFQPATDFSVALDGSTAMLLPTDPDAPLTELRLSTLLPERQAAAGLGLSTVTAQVLAQLEGQGLRADGGAERTQVAGQDALTVALATQDGVKAGRVVVVQLPDGRFFVAQGSAPTAAWAGPVGRSFAGLLETVRFAQAGSAPVAPMVAPTPTVEPAATAAPTATATTPALPTATGTATERATETATQTPTASSTPSEEPTATRTATSEPAATATAEPDATEEPTATATLRATTPATPTRTATQTPTPTPSATAQPTATRRPTVTPTATPTATEATGPEPDAASGAVAGALAGAAAGLAANPVTDTIDLALPGEGAGALTGTGVLSTVQVIQLPVPTPTMTPVRAPGEWTTISDGNQLADLAIVSDTLWLAGSAGAAAWTGNAASPRSFTASDGLHGNQLTAVANCPLDGYGLVFGSPAGLQIYDPQRQAWRFQDSANSDLRFDDVVSLACDPRGRYLVVGYAAHGIDVYDAARDTWRHLDRNSGLAANDARRVAVMGDLDAIWVVSEDGITRSAGSDSAFYTAANSPLAGRIGAVASDGDDTAWLGGEGALYRVRGDAWTVFSQTTVSGDFPTRLITGLAVLDDGTLWLGAEDATVCRFDPEEERCTDFFQGDAGMAAGPLTNLVADGDRVAYTTTGNGYAVLADGRWRTVTDPTSFLLGSRVKALSADDAGNLWVATENGVQRLDREEGPATLFNGDNGGILPLGVRTLQPGPDGAMWVGSMQGASLYDGRRWRSFTTDDGLASNTVQAIAVDGEGRTWFGTDRGLSVWNGTSFFNITRAQGLPSDDVRALAADPTGVWIGTAGGGLYRYENSQLQLLNAQNVGLPSDNVTALALLPAGELLIGTDQGLAQLANGVLTPLASDSPFPITSLAASAQYRWAGTGADGLLFFDGRSWRQQTGANGLPADRITALQLLGNAVWIGGQEGGLARYEP